MILYKTGALFAFAIFIPLTWEMYGEDDLSFAGRTIRSLTLSAFMALIWPIVLVSVVRSD